MARETVRTTETTRRGYRTDEVAKLYGVSEAFIRKEVREGRLKKTKLGKAVVILVEDLRVWEQSAA